MSSPHLFHEDVNVDDAELWAVIDSAAAASHSSTKSRKPLALKQSSPPQPQSLHKSFSLVQSPQFSSKSNSNSRSFNQSSVTDHDVRVQLDGEVLQVKQEPWSERRPNKVARTGSYGDENRLVLAGNSPRMNISYGGNQMVVAKPLQQRQHHQQQRQRSMPNTPTSYSSPESLQEISPVSSYRSPGFQQRNDGEEMRHSLSGNFPSVALFKEYQNAAMAILEKTDYTMIQGSPFIKKSGWRKIAFFFNLSFEIKDKSFEFDENRNVQRAEFIVRAHMQGGRYSDGWGSCERREKRFMKPNQDIPSTAETRAKNKACQDLLGIGQYRQATE